MFKKCPSQCWVAGAGVLGRAAVCGGAAAGAGAGGGGGGAGAAAARSSAATLSNASWSIFAALHRASVETGPAAGRGHDQAGHTHTPTPVFWQIHNKSNCKRLIKKALSIVHSPSNQSILAQLDLSLSNLVLVWSTFIHLQKICFQAFTSFKPLSHHEVLHPGIRTFKVTVTNELVGFYPKR